MAEDQGKQGEDKFEFTSEGEALGYISLPQARLLAMQTARDTPGNYGRRFRGVTMAFEVVESGEDDDYYNITLSFRAEGAFTEASGREQFFIGKEGAVAYRQVVDIPEDGGRWRLPIVIGGVAVVIGAVAIGASSLLGSGPFGAQSPRPIIPVPTPTTIPVVVIPPTDDTPLPTPITSPIGTPQFGQNAITILPRSPARVKSANGDVVVDVAAGSVAAATRMEIRSLSPPDVPLLPPLFRATGKAFDLTTDAPLLNPITIMVQVSEAEVALAGGDGANIVIQRWRAGAWSPLPTSIDFETSMAAAQVISLSIFALTIRDSGRPETVQTTSTLVPTLVPTAIPTPTQSPGATVPIRAAILEIQCGPGFKLRVHISIKSEAGIASYSVWSTWGSLGSVERDFSPPYPTTIDEVVIHDEEYSDTIDRLHQIGLKVVSPGVADPFLTYGLEPDDRCPGHFLSLSSAAPGTPPPTPTPTPTPPVPTPTPTSVSTPTLVPTAIPTRLPTATPLPTPTPQPTATPTPLPTLAVIPTPPPVPPPTSTPSPQPLCIVLEQGVVYRGTTLNLTLGILGQMEVRFIQSGCTLTGFATMGTPESGSGPLQGTLVGNQIELIIPGITNDMGIDIIGDGVVIESSLSGTYRIPLLGQHGVWELSAGF